LALASVALVPLLACQFVFGLHAFGATPDAGVDAAAEEAGADAGDGASSGGAVACADAGPPMVLATDKGTISALATDGAYVYWIARTSATGPVMRVPREGGTPVMVAAASYGLAVDATNIYFGDWTKTAVFAAPSSGGTTVTLTSQDQVSDLVVDATNVYGVDYWQAARTIWKTPIHGGTQKSLGHLNAMEFSKLAVDGSYVYWTETEQDPGVYRAPIDGSSTGAMFVAADHPAGLATDGNNVYWTQPDGGAVWRVASRGGPPKLLTGDLATASSIAVDANGLYWTDPSTGNVWCAGLDGSGAQAVATGQHGPGAIVVDPQNIYWANADVGTIMRMTK
jgi:hypothetical protein